MYHNIVQRKIRKSFSHLNSGNFTLLFRDFSLKMLHTMEGDSSLSGTRRTIESVRVWYERLFRVFPKVQFQIEETIIKGMPWNTKIVNRFTVNIRLADGYAYSNNVAQFIDLKWGKITSMHLYEDTKKLADGLERQLKSGIKEAGLKPIEDSK